MNEEEFVKYLKKNFPFDSGIGIGDDCSVEKCGSINHLITKDLLVENIHFRLNYMSFYEIALKALSVNISDICAMGGIAKSFYLGLGIPLSISQSKIGEFFEGIKFGCKKWDIQLAGGDISKSKELIVSITVKGEAVKPVFRNGAQEDDLICLSGIAGESSGRRS